MDQQKPRIYSIGHSTRSITDFVGLLRAHDIKLLADVRRMPKSRHNPQYNHDVLAGSLNAADVHYIWLQELGGLREPRPNSPNTAIKNPSFRGYADHMSTTAFASAMRELIRQSQMHPTAFMCAEISPQQCHRSLIADALAIRGHHVIHILSAEETQLHQLHPAAVMRDQTLIYPAAQMKLFE